MCGRFVVAQEAGALVGRLRVDLFSDHLPAPSFNVAPTATATVVLDSAKSTPPVRRAEPARWGLIPPWAKDPAVGTRAFNARGEELEHKRTFAPALAAHRAVVPISGYYEWQLRDDGKVPLYIHPGDDEVLLLAGLYGWWKDRDRAEDDPERWVLSFSILTCASTGALAEVHDRMPVVLDPDHVDAWLDPSEDAPLELRDAVLSDAPRMASLLTWHEVDRTVGNVRNNTPDLIAPLR